MGAYKRLMTWLHLLTDCADISKMLNAAIKKLTTIHYSLFTETRPQFRPSGKRNPFTLVWMDHTEDWPTM